MMAVETQEDLQHAREFFHYFQNKHTEKQVDQWLKVYLPAVRAGDLDHKKLRSEITKGNMPMVFRGEVWQSLIGNPLKLNA